MKVDKMASSDIVNVKNYNKQTALHIAVGKNESYVKILLMNGGNPNIKNGEGNNCYHIAAENDFDLCLIDLLRYSLFPPDLNEFNHEGLTPLHIAIEKNSTDCFIILMNSPRADLSVIERKCGRSLLHYAVEFEASLIFPIIEKGETDVNIQDFEGNTPLHTACIIENYDAIKQLLLAGADPLVKNFKRSCLNLEEESSDDDETPIGQTPADLTTDSRILDLLKQAFKKDKPDFDDSTNNSAGTSGDLMTNLCNSLDPDMRWKDVAIYILDEKFLNSLECSDSPTRALLEYMKKTSGKGYIEEFKAVLEMVGLNDAVQIIAESDKSLIEL